MLGARQIGKTYIINEYCEKNFKKYVYINLFRDKRLINIYENNDVYDKRVELLCNIYNFDFEDKNCILFVDEVQLCPLFLLKESSSFKKTLIFEQIKKSFHAKKE